MLVTNSVHPAGTPIATSDDSPSSGSLPASPRPQPQGCGTRRRDSVFVRRQREPSRVRSAASAPRVGVSPPRDRWLRLVLAAKAAAAAQTAATGAGYPYGAHSARSRASASTGAFEGGARTTLRLNAGTCSTSAIIDMLYLYAFTLSSRLCSLRIRTILYDTSTVSSYISLGSSLRVSRKYTVFTKLVSCNQIQTSHSTIRALA